MIVNPTQPYTFKDGHYMVVGAPVLMSNELEIPDDQDDDQYLESDQKFLMDHEYDENEEQMNA